MRYVFVFLLVSGFFYKGSGQWYKNYNPNVNALKLYQLGVRDIQNQNYLGAIQYMQLAIDKDEKYLDAYLSMAGLYGEIKDYNKSTSVYEAAFGLDSIYTKPYLLPYSINVAAMGQFEKAYNAVQKFKTISNLGEKSLKSAAYREKCYEFAVDFAKTYGAFKMEPTNMGDSVNSKDSEYFPSITIDGKKLVFTRRVKNFNEDFYETKWSGDAWGKATALPGDVNTDHNEGAQSISQDGTILFFTGCNFPQGAGQCDLYYTLWINNAWTKPIPAGKNINTEFWESQPCLSPDKRNLYFVARDPASMGGSDIYMSTVSDKGVWGVPVNLGKTINTTGDESSPFMHADGETLYFTSNGHTGYGGEDLFFTRKDASGKWTTPVNLGYPINTVENEGSMVIAADGKTAYYASDRSDTRGGLDIYTFTLPKYAQPRRTFYVAGKVYDSLTKAPISSVVELAEISTGKLIQKIQSNEKGDFLVTLPTGRNYSFTVNRKGFLFYSDNFYLATPENDTTYQKNIPLQPLVKNAQIVLNNIFYETNKFTLKQESQAELNKVVQLLNENPTLKIEISGHTDNVGNSKQNQLLSNNRAMEVAKYIATKGVTKSRVVAKGLGSTRPIADNKSEAGRAKNRRTELKVISI
jgi:outer membrane protein OmpA-like peptidoglycan-associated protein/Tol biopolymer transport system component